MNADTFYSILKHPALLNGVAETELEAITKQYPWFGAARFLLAAKKNNNHSPDAGYHLQKAAMYFSNPLWMGWQLYKFKPTHPFINPATEPVKSEIETNQLPAILQDETDAAIDAAVLTASVDEIEIQKLQDEMNVTIDAAAMIHAADEIETHREQNDPVITVPESITQTLQSIVQKKEGDEQSESETAINFQPYHTVDYFASQGIKLREDKLDDDQLGKQLKTFTQWLKSMKKIYVEEQKELDVASEKEVVDRATYSNRSEEIVTETMANVLVQQGKTAKAIELYGKLILLHPEKSGYFAAKIDELKN